MAGSWQFLCCRHCTHDKPLAEGHFGPCPEDRCKEGKIRIETEETHEAVPDNQKGDD